MARIRTKARRREPPRPRAAPPETPETGGSDKPGVLWRAIESIGSPEWYRERDRARIFRLMVAGARQLLPDGHLRPRRDAKMSTMEDYIVREVLARAPLALQAVNNAKAAETEASARLPHVVLMVEQGEREKIIADALKVSVSTVARLKAKARKRGLLPP